MRSYPVDQLYEEMAFIAFHFHWPRGELMSLEHGERRRWCEEISRINRRLSVTPANPFGGSPSGSNPFDLEGV